MSTQRKNVSTLTSFVVSHVPKCTRLFLRGQRSRAYSLCAERESLGTRLPFPHATTLHLLLNSAQHALGINIPGGDKYRRIFYRDRISTSYLTRLKLVDCYCLLFLFLLCNSSPPLLQFILSYFYHSHSPYWIVFSFHCVWNYYIFYPVKSTATPALTYEKAVELALSAETAAQSVYTVQTLLCKRMRAPA